MCFKICVLDRGLSSAMFARVASAVAKAFLVKYNMHAKRQNV